MALKITKNKKGKKYACITFFPNEKPKKWRFNDLQVFVSFLNKVHPSWKEFNVYDRASKRFLRKFKPGYNIPKTLSLLAIALLLSFSKKLNSQSMTRALALYPWKTTFKKPFTKSFIDGLVNSATISNPHALTL
jgi:hypothetical protein